jgi:hypothetical protein
LEIIKDLIRRTLAYSGWMIVNRRRHYDSDGLFTIHSDTFQHDAKFIAAYRRAVQANNNVDPHLEWRVHVALWVAAASLQARGDFVECGVNTGFLSTAIMEYLKWNEIQKRFYLVDTFAGPCPVGSVSTLKSSLLANSSMASR